MSRILSFRSNLQYHLPSSSAQPSSFSCLPAHGVRSFLQYRGADRCTALVLDTDNSTIVDTGLIKSGEQRCTLKLLDGKFEGTVTHGVNMLNGSLEADKLFVPGDRAMAVVSYRNDDIRSVS